MVVESEVGKTPERYRFLLDLDLINILFSDRVCLSTPLRLSYLEQLNLSMEDFEGLMQNSELLVYPADDPVPGRESLKLVFRDPPYVAFLVLDERYRNDLVLTWVRKSKGDLKEGLYKSFADLDPFRLLMVGESLIADGSNIVRAGQSDDHDCLDHSHGCPDPGRVARLKELIHMEAQWEMANASHSSTKFPKFLCILDENLWEHVDSADELTALTNSNPRLISKAKYADPVVVGRAREIEISQGRVVLLTDDKRMKAQYCDNPKYDWLWEEERFIGHDKSKVSLMYTRSRDRLITDLTAVFNKVAMKEGFRFYPRSIA